MVKLVFSTGRLYCKYPQQTNAQDVVADISSDGTVYVHYNPEIGNSVPSDIWHSIVRRVTLTGITTKNAAKAWFRANKDALAKIVDAMDTKWNGNNIVGVLNTPEAAALLEKLEYDSYNG